MLKNSVYGNITRVDFEPQMMKTSIAVDLVTIMIVDRLRDEALVVRVGISIEGYNL